MSRHSNHISRNGIFVATCVLLLAFIGCITIPLGDPEQAKVNDKLVGAWLTPPESDGSTTLFTVVPYDSRTCLVSEMAFKKDGDTIKPGGRIDWKMWTVDVKGTTFISMEMKNPQLAFGDPEAERFAVAKIVQTADTIVMTSIKDGFVKDAKITTSKELDDLVAANLDNKEMFDSPLTLTRVKDDQKDAMGKVIDAYTQIK